MDPNLTLFEVVYIIYAAIYIWGCSSEGERLLGVEEVAGSSPAISTNKIITVIFQDESRIAGLLLIFG